MSEEEHGCGCGCEESMDEMVEQNNIILNALIDLLIEKKIITEEDLKKKFEDMAASASADAPEEFENDDEEDADEEQDK